MPGSPGSRGNTGSAAASRPSQGPSSETGASAARLLVQLLALVGGGGVAITGAAVAGGLLVHAGHLTMLGLPLFPMSPLAYSQLARQFLMETARLSVSYSWLTASWLAGALVLVSLFAAFPLLSRTRCLDRGGVLDRCTHSPLACPVCLLAVVLASGLLLTQSTAALTRGSSIALLWPIGAGGTLAAEQAFGKKPDGLILSDGNIRWCLFHRTPGYAADPELQRRAGEESEYAWRSLEDYYRWLVGATALLLLLYVAACRARRRQTAPDAGRRGAERASLLAAANLLLQIPAVAILALLLIALPRSYGALIMPTTYPMVEMEKDATTRSSSPGFLVSPATSDAKSVCVLRLESPENRYSGYVLETHSFDPQAGMRVVGYADVLQRAQAQMAADAKPAANAGAEPAPRGGTPQGTDAAAALSPRK